MSHFDRLPTSPSRAVGVGYMVVALGWVTACDQFPSDIPEVIPPELCGPRQARGQLFESVETGIRECREAASRPSTETCATPELGPPDTTSASTRVLTPESCGDLPPEMLSWEQCINQHPLITDFLVTPGDYTAWGRLIVDDQHGLPAQKRVIRYSGPSPNAHPAIRAETGFGNEAIISSFKFNESSHWILHGLTVDGTDAGQDVGQIFSHSSNIILDHLLIENAPQNGVRIRRSDNNCVQNCVIRNAIPDHSDRVGVSIRVLIEATTGNRVVNNEIINFGDAIQLTNDKNFPASAIAGTVIEENDLYVTPEYLDLLANGANGCVENAIDVKIASPDPDRPVVIAHNRIWGYRAVDGCSGSGEAIVIQCSAMNIQIHHNMIFDGPLGIRVERWNLPTDVNVGKCVVVSDPKSRDVLIENNLFYDIRSFESSAEGHLNGTILHIGTPHERVHRNVFAQSDTLLELRDGVVISEVELEFNESVGVTELPPLWGSSVSITNRDFAPAEAAHFTFWIKRWTGPTPVTLHRAYVSRSGRR